MKYPYYLIKTTFCHHSLDYKNSLLIFDWSNMIVKHFKLSLKEYQLGWFV